MLVDARPDFAIMLFARGVIGPSSVLVIGGLTGEMDDIRVDTLTEVYIADMVVSTFVGVAPAL